VIPACQGPIGIHKETNLITDLDGLNQLEITGDQLVSAMMGAAR
jgi:hypothetical protein